MKQLIKILSLGALMSATAIVPMGLFSKPGSLAKTLYWGLTVGTPIGTGLYYSKIGSNIKNNPAVQFELEKNKHTTKATITYNHDNTQKWNLEKSDLGIAAISTSIPFGLHGIEKYITPKNFMQRPYIRMPFAAVNMLIGFGTLWAYNNYQFTKTTTN